MKNEKPMSKYGEPFRCYFARPPCTLPRHQMGYTKLTNQKHLECGRTVAESKIKRDLFLVQKMRFTFSRVYSVCLYFVRVRYVMLTLTS